MNVGVVDIGRADGRALELSGRQGRYLYLDAGFAGAQGGLRVCGGLLEPQEGYARGGGTIRRSVSLLMSLSLPLVVARTLIVVIAMEIDPIRRLHFDGCTHHVFLRRYEVNARFGRLDRPLLDDGPTPADDAADAVALSGDALAPSAAGVFCDVGLL